MPWHGFVCVLMQRHLNIIIKQLVSTMQPTILACSVYHNRYKEGVGKS